MHGNTKIKVPTTVLKLLGCHTFFIGNYAPKFRRSVVRFSALFGLSEPADEVNALLSNTINYLPVYTAQHL